MLGYLWGKEAYGAMLWAGAVSDLTIAEHLEDPRYRPLMLAVAREVLAQAPVPVESFDGFEPGDLEGSLDRLAAFNRASAKQYSGIYRDLVVRQRKTEIDEVLRDISGPVFDKVADIIHDIEAGRRVNERANPRRARGLRRRPPSAVRRTPCAPPSSTANATSASPRHPTPELLAGPGATGRDAIVRVTASCVCGSDLWGLPRRPAP